MLKHKLKVLRPFELLRNSPFVVSIKLDKGSYCEELTNLLSRPNDNLYSLAFNTNNKECLEN